MISTRFARTAFVVALGLAMVPTSLSASCPRTGGEKARRILPAVVLFPYGLFVFRHGQSRVEMPAEGVRVRMSYDTPQGVGFTEGTFVAMRDSVFQLQVGARDTISFPFATTRCLQVHRLSRWNGAALGLMTGGWIGLIAGGALGSLSGDAWTTAASSLMGGLLGEIVAPILLARRGIAAWDVAWDVAWERGGVAR